MSGSDATSIRGLHWSGDGNAALSGALLERAHEIDDVFRRWARAIGATEYAFPSLIRMRDLSPIAYLSSFPHLATFATGAARDDQSLRDLARDFGKADAIAPEAGRFAAAEHLLTPAACYHFYPKLAGENLPAPQFLTTNCQCHRREDHYEPLQRQWSFRMRELVCIGTADATSRHMSDMIGRIDALASELGLETGWTTASDPFFDPEGDPKALAQRIEPSKQELCIPNGLAIASVNDHRSFFGECYDIHVAGEVAHSACVAFGIERWLYALHDVHGDDPGTWPAAGGLQ